MLCIVSFNTSAKYIIDDIVSYVIPQKQEQVTTHEYKFDKDGILKIYNSHGEVSVKTWNQDQILIETIKKGYEKEIEEISSDIYLSPELISIATKQPEKNNASIAYNIIMPRGASILIKNSSGTTTINSLQGNIYIEAEHGPIMINDSSNKVYARTLSGDIILKAQKLPHNDSHIILETLKGDIAAHFSSEIKGKVHAKTSRGKILSDIDITLNPCTTKINQDFWKSIKKEIQGSIGKGNSEIKMFTQNGHVAIREY
jgi:hypothetical protein